MKTFIDALENINIEIAFLKKEIEDKDLWIELLQEEINSLKQKLWATELNREEEKLDREEEKRLRYGE
tara:strand:- start:79 stop:282 length:204 start_codon:yes stop_codon:yes gene_type:complete